MVEAIGVVVTSLMVLIDSGNGVCDGEVMLVMIVKVVDVANSDGRGGGGSDVVMTADIIIMMKVAGVVVTNNSYLQW
ncbi:hypothetical protein HAX54_037459 [Datura stramonium]|uniref:Uncharacterized protein n=1 Tax=Datura stramonium TaxID=4076 RepID=A0ABS8SH30_DATST|nr:hypothetical protein [Datura stramonium]